MWWITGFLYTLKHMPWQLLYYPCITAISLRLKFSDCQHDPASTTETAVEGLSWHSAVFFTQMCVCFCCALSGLTELGQSAACWSFFVWTPAPLCFQLMLDGVFLGKKTATGCRHQVPFVKSSLCESISEAETTLDFVLLCSCAACVLLGLHLDSTAAAGVHPCAGETHLFAGWI